MMLCMCPQPCVDRSFTRLTCVMPSIELPEEFRNLSDPSLTFPYNNLSLHSSPVTSYNDRNSTLDFTESVLLDDVTHRLNESFDFQFISLFPSIIDSGPYKLDMSDKWPINIQGMHLDRGVTRSADYSVILGDGRCKPQDELNSTMFQCSPPTSAPNSTNVDDSHCNDSFALMVRLGDRSLGSAGCLFYPDVSQATSSAATGRSLPLIVIVGSIGVALILLLTLVVLRAYMRQRRGIDEDRKPLDRHTDANGTLNGHAVNGLRTSAYANHDQYRASNDTMEMSEYTNATEFRQHPRRITSEIGYY